MVISSQIRFALQNWGTKSVYVYVYETIVSYFPLEVEFMFEIRRAFSTA